MAISQLAAVLLTLSYVDQFSFPLILSEIRQRLIKESLSKKEVAKALFFLKKNNLVTLNNHFWKLKAGQADFRIRLSREKISQQKWQEVKKIIHLIEWIPWVEGVAITGSLAVNNVTSEADIDLMMVVTRGRLWLTRILVLLSTVWVGKRRTWQGNEENSWCFNLWLDNEHLKLPAHKRNLYSAYEVCQTKWVLDKSGVERQFYNANLWVKKILPTYFESNYHSLPSVRKKQSNEYQSAPILRFVGRQLLTLLNLVFFLLQYGYMYPHMSREIVTLGSAYFHPRSTKGQIYANLKVVLNRLQQARPFQKSRPRIVLVTGVFDLFHQEHQNFLRKAKQSGDILVVGIESDARVKKNKGTDRPIDDELKRLQQLQLFPVVDLVFILPEKFDNPTEHLALLKLIKPQVLAVSSHTPFLKEKRQLMAKVGGEVKVVYEQNPEVSTTKLKKIMKGR